MAGLCGIYYRAADRPVSPSLLEAMHAADPGRGPEGFDSLTKVPVGLGYQNFSPWDRRPQGQLPIRSAQLILSCDTRLDNPQELQRRLEIDGPEIPCDAELILAAFRRWGEDFPRYLDGDFAILLFDADSRIFYACRDPLGVRDLAYSLSEDHLIVASSPAQVSAIVGRKINEGRLAEFLAGLFYNREETFFEGIFYLPPGACLIVSPDSSRLWKYWELDPWAPPPAGGTEDMIEEFSSILRQSLTNRLNSASSIGISLSGGPDSATIAALAPMLAPATRLAAFSYVFPRHPSCDERGYIDAILARSGLEGRFLDGDHLWPLADFESWPVFPDYPSQDPYVRLPLGLCQMAASEGFHILLNGHYSDLLFHGGRYWAAEQLSQPLHLLSTLLHQSSSIDWRGDFLARGLASRLPLPFTTTLQWLRHRGNRSRRAFPMLDPDCVERCVLHHRLQSQSLSHTSGRRDRSLRARHLLMPLIPQGASAARRLHNSLGVEIVDPFWDRHVVEFVSSCPADLLATPRHTKWLLRKAIDAHLPTEVAWRQDKTSLYELFKEGLLLRQKTNVHDLFGNAELLKRGFIDHQWLRREREAGERWADFGFLLWRCLNAEMWLRSLNNTRNQSTMEKK